MSSAAAAPLMNPSVDQIRAQHSQAVKVYNPTDETVTVPQYGDDYTFPPDFELEIGPKYRYLMLLDKNPKSASNGVAWDDPKAHPRDKTAPRKIEAEAAQIAAEICLPERMGAKGFCVLLNDGHDDQRKLAARQKWVAWRLKDATSRHQAVAVRFQNTTPGFTPLIKRDESAALLWIDRYNRGEFNSYISAVSEATTKEDLARLARLTPGLDLPEAAPTKAAAASPVEPVIADEGPEFGAGYILLSKAKKAKITLSRAELEGLLEENEKVIASVARKVAKRG